MLQHENQTLQKENELTISHLSDTWSECWKCQPFHVACHSVTSHLALIQLCRLMGGLPMKGQIPAVVITPAFFPFTHSVEQRVLFDRRYLNITMSHASVLCMDTYQTWPLTQWPKETAFEMTGHVVSILVLCTEWNYWDHDSESKHSHRVKMWTFLCNPTSTSHSLCCHLIQRSYICCGNVL